MQYLHSSENAIAILEDRWRRNAAKQEGDKINKTLLCYTWKQRHERLIVGGASIRSRNGATSRKGCMRGK